MSDVNVSITPSGLALSMLIDGKRQYQPIPVGELLSAVGNATTKTSGWLPPNTRDWIEVGNRVMMVVEVPMGTHDLTVLHDNSYLKKGKMVIKGVPLPTALFFFDLSKQSDGYRISSCKIYALPGRFNGDKATKLFLYPAPNVQSPQTICWGFDSYSAKNMTYKTMTALEGAVQLFYEAAFNDHCFTKERLASSFDWGSIDYRAVEQYFEKLKEYGYFDPKWLKPSGTTYAEVVGQI